MNTWQNNAANTGVTNGDYVILWGSFILFTLVVAGFTWWKTRHSELTNPIGFFLAGRKLTFPFIAGSLLLTNLSTEQLIGLNGDGFASGLQVMAWEIVAVVALVAMALFFLPKFLRAEITTIPEMLGLRFDSTTRLLSNVIFLLAYSLILLPLLLYTGAQGLINMFNLAELTGQSSSAVLWQVCVLIAFIGSIYALFGGMRAVAISDALNGIGIIVGGLLISYFGLAALGDGHGALAGWRTLTAMNATGQSLNDFNHLNSVGDSYGLVPFSTLFTGVLLINLFYWCTNQQIIQRAVAARSLAEGQKGVLLCGAFKLLGPLYLVLPGIIAYFLWKRGMIALPFVRDVETHQLVLNQFGERIIDRTAAYGVLALKVLPKSLTGFFAAALLGAILSSFNSVLHSVCTMFSLGVYKPLVNRSASEKQIVNAGKCFGWVVAIAALLIAPLLVHQTSIYTYLQTTNTIYFIPLLAVMLIGLLTRHTPAGPANIALVAGVTILTTYYFVIKPAWLLTAGRAALHNEINIGQTMLDFARDNEHLPAVQRLLTYCGAEYLPSDFHIAAIVFVALIAFMLIWRQFAPRSTAWVNENFSATRQSESWRWAKPVSGLLLVLMIVIYAVFADFSDWRRQENQHRQTTREGAMRILSQEMHHPHSGGR